MNLPNKISLSRICLIPIFVAVFFLDGILPFAFGISAIIFAIAFALLFSYVRSRSNQAADTLIGVFSSTAVALGIFIAGGLMFSVYAVFIGGKRK